jgi:hypothetical protein
MWLCTRTQLYDMAIENATFTMVLTCLCFLSYLAILIFEVLKLLIKPTST